MEVGISTWTLPWAIGVSNYPRPSVQLDSIGLMSLASKLGVNVVQIADNLPADRLPDSELDRIAEYSIERGLSLELGTRSVEPEHLRRYVEIAARVRSRVVRTVLSGKLSGPAEAMRVQECLRLLLPDLERYEVQIALENNEALTAAEFSSIVRALDSPLIGICLDTANSLGVPETLERVVEELAPHTIMLHAKDYDICRIDTRMGFTVEGRALGDGCVDFHYVMSRLRERGRDEISCIIEHWPPFERDIATSVRREAEWLTRSLEFIRPVVSSQASARVHTHGTT